MEQVSNWSQLYSKEIVLTNVKRVYYKEISMNHKQIQAEWLNKKANLFHSRGWIGYLKPKRKITSKVIYHRLRFISNFSINIQKRLRLQRTNLTSLMEIVKYAKVRSKTNLWLCCNLHLNNKVLIISIFPSSVSSW